MDNTQQQHWIAGFIWSIADDVLRDVYVRGKYRDVILPMTVIRRLDALLEPSKQAVLSRKAQLDKMGITNQGPALQLEAGQAFYNDSRFSLKDLTARGKSQQLQADFEAYLEGFSENVQEILEKFKFRNQLPTLTEEDLLGHLIEKFLDPRINLSPKPVLDGSGQVRLPGLDNHTMGTVFEELIRRFNEENNEEAGEHFTPRDVVDLMAKLIFLPIADKIESGTYTVYDGACGTGGMLTVAEETLLHLSQQHGKEVSIHLFGQETQPETYAICKADMLIKGEGLETDNITYGSTLSKDGFPAREFDFMLSNPPYGKTWKTDLEKMGGNKNFNDPRYVIQHGDDPAYKMKTRSSDGQLLFLVNKLMKMKHNSKLGSRIAEVHNGSSLFTGDAGQGESNIRRWIMENDWLEAIIALPENIFYNTGIATYIWVLTNQKAPNRKGKVQLIDASGWYESRRKNLGKKNCDLSAPDMERVCDLMLNPRETEQSKLLPNEAFGYWKVTVERPLRLHAKVAHEAVEALRFGKKQSELRKQLYQAAGASLYDHFTEAQKRFDEYLEDNEITLTETQKKPLYDRATWLKDKEIYDAAKALWASLSGQLYVDHNAFKVVVDKTLKEQGIRLAAAQQKALLEGLSWREDNAPPVIKKTHKLGKVQPDPLRGLFEGTIDGKPCVVEYEPDTSLRDTEQVPLLEPGGIEAFIQREVLPYVYDAWLDESKTQIGYEISFTKHFYKPQPLRSLDEIRADIQALEQETDGLLVEIVGSR